MGEAMGDRRQERRGVVQKGTIFGIECASHASLNFAASLVRQQQHVLSSLVFPVDTPRAISLFWR